MQLECSASGGPEGIEPKPMITPIEVQSVGEEVPLQFNRIYEVAVFQNSKQSRLAMRQLPFSLQERARNDRRVQRLEWLASRPQRQSEKDQARAYGQRAMYRLNHLTVGG